MRITGGSRGSLGVLRHADSLTLREASPDQAYEECLCSCSRKACPEPTMYLTIGLSLPKNVSVSNVIRRGVHVKQAGWAGISGVAARAFAVRRGIHTSSH